jgi:uncharacterized membrane protein YdjX (TVP38/TMEM64 family)
MKENSAYLWLFILIWGGTIALYFWFSRSPYFESFQIWTQQNLLLFYLSLFTAKVLAIVWPPLPGSLFTLGSIPLIGWAESFLIDLAGALTGASIAYFLGRKYGYRFLEKIFNDELVRKIRETHIKPDREIESILIGRIVGNGNLMELVCYGAGVLRVRYHNFLIASFLAGLISLPIYYLGGNLFDGGSILAGALIGLTTLLIFWKLKVRYVE